MNLSNKQSYSNQYGNWQLTKSQGNFRTASRTNSSKCILESCVDFIDEINYKVCY